eukprot:5367253-Pyramimonas_sp.AAC.1
MESINQPCVHVTSMFGASALGLERKYPARDPIATGTREYTRSGNQSQKGGEKCYRCGREPAHTRPSPTRRPRQRPLTLIAEAIRLVDTLNRYS